MRESTGYKSMYFLACTWSRRFVILRERLACGGSDAPDETKLLRKDIALDYGILSCVAENLLRIRDGPGVAAYTPAFARVSGIARPLIRTAFQSTNQSSINPFARCAAACSQVVRSTLGLGRLQTADLQPQTVNQCAAIGAAPPVMVVTLPVPFINPFKA